MICFWGRRILTIGVCLLALFWLASCSSPDRLEHNEDASATDQSQLPFHDGVAPSSANGSARTQPGAGRSNDLPFRAPQQLPAGTMLTIRLQHPLATDHSDAERTFEAVIDRPVVVDGDRLVPIGASVTGRVESARASNFKSNHGYLQLTLTSIQLAGLKLPVQTSSLFVRGEAGRSGAPSDAAWAKSARPVIYLEKGRQLVFRLTEPVD